MPEISIVIPVYRSAPWLEELIQEVSQVLENHSLSHEIILIDDSSPDNSWQVIKDIAKNNTAVRGFQLMNNEGQIRATLCGLRHSQGNIVVTMDDDFQHRPDQILLLIDALNNNPEMDCVLGVFESKKHSLYRNLGSRIINRLNQSAFNMPKGISSSGFRAMRRKLVDAVCAHNILNPSLAMLIFSSTRRVMNITLEHASRRAGKSNYTLRKQFRLAFDNICHASMLPLRLVSLTGLAASGLSLALMIFYFLRYLLGAIHVPGWTTIILLLTFFSGVILFALGVIGEYLFMVLKEVRGSPLYFIRATTASAEKQCSKGEANER
ncbi:glycosyltransferase family 2 protein [Desulfonatronovibrio magnus]|uniref:glycosyltransferase family 2 protein n=1 Tax=Desulfonatronovibrio magnus TaxID=698827 RepID=UPI0005EB369F|nr:glycosyltransferase family 2 protein [Desulfonatronovibrio magnus]